jgi:hypothetical protein
MDLLMVYILHADHTNLNACCSFYSFHPNTFPPQMKFMLSEGEGVFTNSKFTQV